MMEQVRITMCKSGDRLQLVVRVKRYLSMRKETTTLLMAFPEIRQGREFRERSGVEVVRQLGLSWGLIHFPGTQGVPEGHWGYY